MDMVFVIKATSLLLLLLLCNVAQLKGAAASHDMLVVGAVLAARTTIGCQGSAFALADEWAWKLLPHSAELS